MSQDKANEKIKQLGKGSSIRHLVRTSTMWTLNLSMVSICNTNCKYTNVQNVHIPWDHLPNP